ncbi:MAG: hypothetical protein ABSC19_07415 [Syntrophorhabdales bacterium]|jgi:hypothetical protein
MIRHDKAGNEAMIAIMDRITILFNRLIALEDKLKRYGTGDGDAGLIPAMLATQLKALRLVAAIEREIGKGEALLKALG